VIWGFWRWLKIKQDNLRILGNPVERLQAPEVEIIDASLDDSLPRIESDILNNDYQLTRPDDQVRRWLEEVKRKLLRSDRKDDEDNGTDS